MSVKLNGAVRELLMRALLTLLLSLGLTLPFLQVLGLLGFGMMAAGVLVLLAALLAFSGTGIWARAAVGGLLCLAGGIWLVGSGVQAVIEIVRGAALYVSGLTTALPLRGRETAVLLAVIASLLSYLFTSRMVGGAPAMLMTALAVMVLWLGGSGHMMLLTMPALAASAVILSRANHPEASAGKLLPWMCALSLIACLIVPAAGVTVEPLKEAAEQLRQKVYDYFFFNQSRDIFTLAAEGYYPQGLGQLGGTASPSAHPVMTVKTDRRVYLRGVMKDTYTGRVWLDTIGSKRYLWASPARRGERDAAFDAALPAAGLQSDTVMPVSQITVTMLADSTSTLFVPQRIRSLNVGGDLVPYFNDASEVFITRDLNEGDTYTVTAPLMIGGDVGLETIVSASEANADWNAYERMQDRYTALPDHMQSQVFSLAVTAAGDASTPYQKAMAVQNFLRRTYRYDLVVDEQPGNVDFVTNFLLNTKEGYCTYFASSMTVLCRMLGLPARYVEGYLAEPGANGMAYVDGTCAHAWTEVYFAGFGWLTFDATPPQHNQHQDPNEQNDPPRDEPDQPPEAPDQPDPTPTPEPNDGPRDDPEPTEQPTTEPGVYVDPAQQVDPDDPDDPDDPPPDLSWLMGALLALLLLLLIAAAVWQMLRMRPEALVKKAADDEARWQIWAQAVHDELRILHLPRQAEETPLIYLCRLADLPDMPDSLALLGETENYLCYGRYVPGAEAVEDAAASYRSVYALFKPMQKMKLLLLRGFVPVRKRSWTR